MEEQSERAVIRFSHCQKEIFCFCLPEQCPCCGEELRGSRLQEAPVSIPSPLTNGHKTSCCLLVTPAHDNEDRDFDGTSDLHTGISNTKGGTQGTEIREASPVPFLAASLSSGSAETRLGGSAASAFLWFDLTCSTYWLSGTSTWTASLMDQCGTLPGTGTPETCSGLCDHRVPFSDHPSHSPHLSLRFDEDHHNCFSFCLGFINGVLAVEGRSPLSRDSFAHTFILPRMRRVSKYTTLHQHIQRHQYYVVDQQEDQQEETPVKPGLFQ
ncbi:hypothetical protein Q8A73_006173 [Channa argus]|nr:hypothetical protein Q8A73_006173 [Channa argus]